MRLHKNLSVTDLLLSKQLVLFQVPANVLITHSWLTFACYLLHTMWHCYCVHLPVGHTHALWFLQTRLRNDLYCVNGTLNSAIPYHTVISHTDLWDCCSTRFMPFLTVAKVVLWSRGRGLTWRSQVGANPIPIPTH